MSKRSERQEPEPFAPTARQLNVILTLGFASLAYAFYLRYLAVEQSTVGLACEAGVQTWLCLARKIAIALFTYSVFGIVAIALALLNLIRPNVMLFTLALCAAAFGIILYNISTSAIAAALLIFSLARPRYVEPADG